MRMLINQTRVHRWGNTLGLIAISFILSMAFYFELSHHHLPCPLCLLQRACLTAVGIMMLSNLFIECRGAHYGLMILAALLGLAVATRQILLHIVPGDPGFGPPFLGLHLYSWCAIIFLILTLCASLALLFDKGFAVAQKTNLSRVIAVIFLTLVLANTVGTFLECGLQECPEDPVKYKLLSML